MYSFLGHKNLLIKADTIVPWDVSTLSPSRSGNIDSDYNLFISPDGLNVYAYDASTLLISQYPLSTAFDNDSIGSLSSSFDASGQLGAPSNIHFSYDGSTMFLVEPGEFSGTVYMYTLSTPWLVSTAVYQSSLLVDYMTWFRDIYFVGNGYIMYVIGWESWRYDLTTPYDISTAVKSSQSLSSTPANFLNFSNDGRYAIGLSGYYVESFEMTTPYDISTLTQFASFLMIGTIEKSTYGLFVDRAGQYVFNTGTNYNIFYRQSLSVVDKPAPIGPWVENTDIVSGLGDLDDDSSPAIVKIASDYYLLATNGLDTTLNSWKWNGSAWVTDTTINSGLSLLETDELIHPVYIGDSIYLIIVDNSADVFRGFLWNGASWDSNSAIVSNLSSPGNPAITTFYIGSVLYCIVATYSQIWTAYTWTGSGWTTNASVLAGLDMDSSYAYRVSAFYLQGELYLLVPHRSTYVDGYKWNGSTWVSFPTIMGGLEGDIGSYEEPVVFYFDNKLYLIFGTSYGTFNGYEY